MLQVMKVVSQLLYSILGWLCSWIMKAEQNLVCVILKWLSKAVAPWPYVMKVGIPVSLVNMLVKMIVTPKVKMKAEDIKSCYTLNCPFLTSV